MTAPAALAQSETGVAAAAAPVPGNVVAVVPRSWPPQYSVDDSGQPTGFAIDVMDAIAARAGLTVTYVIAENFAATDEILLRGDADLIPNSGILAERMDTFAFTSPVETFVVSLFIRNDTDDIGDTSDLIGRKLAVVERNIGLFMFGERQDIQVQVFGDVRTALFELIAGQVDALVYPQPVLLELTREIGVEERIKIAGPPLKEIRRGIRVLKDNVELLAVLNRAVEHFVVTPEYQQIYTKWYGSPTPFWTVTRVTWAMGTFAFLLLIFMTWWRYRTVLNLNRDLQQTMAERQIAEQQLDERQARLHAIMESAADGIITIDEGGQIESFNHAAELLFGYTPDEVIGRNIRILMPEPHRGGHDGYLKRYLDTGQARIIGVGSRELGGLRKDGTQFPMDLAISEMTAGDRRRFIGIVRDISERKEQQAQLKQSQKMEAVGQLTGGIAHDFNNLLTTILGNLELQSDRIEDNEPARAFAEAATRAALRGADLTQRLLAFSRNQPLNPKSINVNQLMPNTTELMRRTLGEDIEIEMVLGGGLWNAMMDQAQLENTILNLSINSRDAMPDGGRLTIETANVRLDQEYSDTRDEVTPGQYVMVAVSDTGTGMPPEVLEKAFDPFFTTKEVGKGTGLGLSMVYGFIKQSGGHMAIYSELGDGTTVKLYLPKATEADTPRPVAGRRSKAMPVGDEIILVVEDDPDVRRFLATSLEMLGYNILEAEDGPQARSVLNETSRIDLLLTDVVLPRGMNGREVADAARAHHPEIKVLFTSGYTENAVIHHRKVDEGVELLSKPYTRQVLAQRVRQVLDTPH